MSKANSLYGKETTVSDTSGTKVHKVPDGAFTTEDHKPRYTAHVRYWLKDKSQSILKPITADIPTDAIAVSKAIYFLSGDQESRLHQRRATSKQLQNECNDDSQMVYLIVAESDALERDDEPDETVETIVDWLSTFIEEWVGIEEYDLYYSGGRSIHLHTDRYITHDRIDQLRHLAKRFNEEHGADLDTGIYEPKRQFRVIGAKHKEKGMYKVPIEPTDTRSDCVRKAMTFEGNAQTIHSVPEPNHSDSITPNPHYLLSPSTYTAGDSDRDAIPLEFKGQLIQGYIKENAGGSRNTSCYDRDYATQFSPYANTGGGTGARSVMIIEQIDGLFCDREDSTVYVPAYIKYAIGGGDGEYKRWNSKSLVKLSDRDASKWEYEPGDKVIIIGGRSRSSRIISPSDSTWFTTFQILSNEGRRFAKVYLEMKGFDIGSSGNHSGSSGSGSRTSEAAKIKREIDRGERTPDHNDILRVSCRLLQSRGWSAAWDWCRDYFGDGFDERATYDRLKKFVEYWDDSFEHVSVPEYEHVVNGVQG